MSSPTRWSRRSRCSTPSQSRRLLAKISEPEADDEADSTPATRDDLLAALDESTERVLELLPAAAREDAEAFLADPRLMNHLVSDIAAMGVVGETELALSNYVIGVSRLLTPP